MDKKSIENFYIHLYNFLYRNAPKSLHHTPATEAILKKLSRGARNRNVYYSKLGNQKRNFIPR